MIEALSHLWAPENAPFAWALGIFLGVGILQVIAFFLGAHLFSALDHALPGADLDLDAGPDPALPGFLESASSVLGLGKVPIVISVLILLFAFAFVGYNLQLVLSLTPVGALAPGVAAAVSFVGSLPLLRLGNEVIARILPQEESLAVSEASFIGKIAVITLGTVTRERSSEARLLDEHGRTHYVHVVADEPGAEFHAGEEVILVGRDGPRFLVVGSFTSMMEKDEHGTEE
jgi:hypothetical protein